MPLEDRFNDKVLNGAWPTSGRAPTLDRSDRVKLLGEVAQALLAGMEPSRVSALFLAGAIQAWLAGGGAGQP